MMTKNVGGNLMETTVEKINDLSLNVVVKSTTFYHEASNDITEAFATVTWKFSNADLTEDRWYVTYPDKFIFRSTSHKLLEEAISDANRRLRDYVLMEQEAKRLIDEAVASNKIE